MKSAKRPRFAVLTSGSDAQGMNACVRAVTKYALHRGCEVYLVRDGFDGLLRGAEQKAKEGTENSKSSRKQVAEELGCPLSYGETDELKEGGDAPEMTGKYFLRAGWDDVNRWIDQGGTLLGTTRSAGFRTREGRLTAARTLLAYEIDVLVVVGGNGTMTGAWVLEKEWEGLVKELGEKPRKLTVTGVVASIYNDTALTDQTIGALTAVLRICEAVDALSTTAGSHQRVFVVEVMGLHSGWLALQAGIAAGADYLFIPERPPAAADWKELMCGKLKQLREIGKRRTIVLVAEGARDAHLKPIKSAEVAELLTNRLGLNTRITQLGHVQRGGKPCAFDRMLATLQGVHAVQASLDSLEATDPQPPYMIAWKAGEVTKVPLAKAVNIISQIEKANAAKDFAAIRRLRSPEFDEALETLEYLSHFGEDWRLPEAERMRIAVVHVGAPAGGMNAFVRSFARFALARGHTPLAIHSGIPGLLADRVSPLSWLRVDFWSSRGGCDIGTDRTLPSEVGLGEVAMKLQEWGVQGLVIVGGWEAWEAGKQIVKGRKDWPWFRGPLVIAPATISNNVPGTSASIGSDTSLNTLVEYCDVIRQSASASNNRAFVVETQGGRSGYLATVGALASSASIVYTPEVGISLDLLEKDCAFLRKRFELDAKGKNEGRLLIRNEAASSVYTTEHVTALLNECGGDLFDARSAILGHTLQGLVPSPLDRTRAARLAVRAVRFLEEHRRAAKRGLSRDLIPVGIWNEKEDEEKGAAVAGVEGEEVRFSSIAEVRAREDRKNRRGTGNAWESLRGLVEVLQGRRALAGGGHHDEGCW